VPNSVPIIAYAGERYSVALYDHVRVLDVNRLRQKIGKLSANAILALGVGLAFVFDISQRMWVYLSQNPP